MLGLIHELRRRRVFRMLALYVVTSWLVIQVASEALPAFDMPEAAIRYVWAAAIAGLPIALIFSWLYDITADGIRRTPTADEEAGGAQPLGRVDYVLLLLLGGIALGTLFTSGQYLFDVQSNVATSPETRRIQPNSLAVLPLENLSVDPDGRFFAAGVHDALITSLSQISGLLVTSRTSALRVSSTLSVPEIGRRLGVAKIIEGSILIDEGRVRVIVQLIDTATDLHVWADTFERDLEDIIGLQNDLARSIADVIEVRFAQSRTERMAAVEPVDPALYREYLKGMYQFRREIGPADAKGIELLEDFAAKDPDNPLGHAGVAYAYSHIAHSPFPGDAYPKAKAAADRALELDPELAEVHLAIGMYRYYYEWDLPGAERSLKRSVELSPNLVEAWYHLAWLYEVWGKARHDEAIAAGEKTRELDPLSPFMIGWLAEQYREACQYDEAIDLAREAIRLDPAFPIGWYSLGLSYADTGQFDEAIDAHGRLEDNPEWAWISGVSFAYAGLDDRARAVAASIEAYPGMEVPLALIYSSLADVDAALQWIGMAREQRVPWFPAMLGWFSSTPQVDAAPQMLAWANELGMPAPATTGCSR